MMVMRCLLHSGQAVEWVSASASHTSTLYRIANLIRACVSGVADVPGIKLLRPVGQDPNDVNQGQVGDW